MPSITSYSGFTLENIGNFGSGRMSITSVPNSIFNSFGFDATDFSKYVYYSTAVDRVNFHVTNVLTTYPVGLNGVVASALTGSYSIYQSLLDWKTKANFVDKYCLYLMSNSATLTAMIFSNESGTSAVTAEWIYRTSQNNLYGASAVSNIINFLTSASSYDGYIFD